MNTNKENKGKQTPLLSELGWVTNEQVIEGLGLSKRTVQTYRDKKMIGYSIIGNKIFYKRDEINALIESGYQSAREQTRTEILDKLAETAEKKWGKEYEKDLPISVLNLSVRSFNGLSSIGVKNVKDITDIGIIGLLRVRGLGKKSITEIKESLAQYAVKL